MQARFEQHVAIFAKAIDVTQSEKAQANASILMDLSQPGQRMIGRGTTQAYSKWLTGVVDWVCGTMALISVSLIRDVIIRISSDGEKKIEFKYEK